MVLRGWGSLTSKLAGRLIPSAPPPYEGQSLSMTKIAVA